MTGPLIQVYDQLEQTGTGDLVKVLRVTNDWIRVIKLKGGRPFRLTWDQVAAYYRKAAAE